MYQRISQHSQPLSCRRRLTVPSHGNAGWSHGSGDVGPVRVSLLAEALKDVGRELPQAYVRHEHGRDRQSDVGGAQKLLLGAL